jgi:hypothetical protein
MGETSMPTQQAAEVLNREFPTIRAGLIALAAALDRIDRAEGRPETDRMDRIQEAVQAIANDDSGRAERVQMIFSLPHDE